MPRRVIISGGGTGGHIFPAIAIADAIKQLDPQIDILFVGARGRMEMSRVPDAGYPIKGLWISGFKRSFSLKNLLFPLKLLVSMTQAFFLLIRFKPDLALGVGGYASGPVLKAATWLGIKTAIQEQNALPGVTNQLLASKVNRVFVAYPNMERFFPFDKLRYFGNPVRSSLMQMHDKLIESRELFGLDPEKKVVLVFGGSLGAGILNECMDKGYALINNHPEVQWIWQTGGAYEVTYRDSATAKLPFVKRLTFIDRMDAAYRAADLVVCRAGALTIAEICLLGKASILVPSPFVAEDHQTVNAKALAEAGAAKMISQRDAANELIEMSIDLVSKPELIQEIGKHAKAMGMPDADKHIAHSLIELISEKENGRS